MIPRRPRTTRTATLFPYTTLFRSGGNAVDAAVAAALVETVWLPMKCGLAGDVVALLQRAGGPVEALLAIGRGPLALNQGARLQATGPASVGEVGRASCREKGCQYG